ncbi:MAG: zf-HC2 domain-containing protein [Candidatus Latescibacterota bacterium]|nr:MAG: zf-HC2 domain-containing protein [Candidatus Latescibacterota bacterium]
MDCKKAYDLIHEVIDGTARGGDRVAVKRHVARCDRCAERFHSQRSLMGYLNRLEVEEVPEGFGERVIGYLKATGRIVETVTAHEPERGALGRIFDWLPVSVRIPVGAAATLLVVFAVVSIASGQFTGFVGKSTVMATNAYIDVQNTMGSVEVLNGFFDGVSRNLRTGKTILSAGLSLLSEAGNTYMIPAIGMFVMLTIGLGWYIRTARRRRTENASIIC